VSGALLSHAHWQLTHYQQKFSTRLSPRNLLHIKQLLFLLSCLLKALGLSTKDKDKDKDDKEIKAAMYCTMCDKQEGSMRE